MHADNQSHTCVRSCAGNLPGPSDPAITVHDVWACLADLVGNCTLETAQETAQAILKVNTLLHAELPGAHLLSLAVLPKGEMWPNRCTDAILAVNAELQVCQPATLVPECWCVG